MKYWSFLILLIGSSFVRKSEKPDVAWTLKKEVDGIKIYTRNSTSGKKELKLITYMQTRLNPLISFLSDKNNYKNWVYGCEESYLIKSVHEFEAYHYQRTSPPWPMSDRDLIIHSYIKYDEASKSVFISATGIPDYLNEKEGIVRVPTFNSYWKIQAIRPDYYELEHFVSLDPGGEVPSWILNMAISEGPVKSIKKMKSLVPEYSENLTPSIKN